MSCFELDVLRYRYKVKVINPHKKSDIVMRQLHHFHDKFSSVMSIRTQLLDELKDQLPDSISFNVGYFEGQQHTKMLIANKDDIKAMYTKYPRGEITLWCDGRQDESSGRTKRKRDEQLSTKYNEREEEVEQIFKDLKERHGEKLELPKLRLWARMIASNLHESLDDPPNIPAFYGSTIKKSRQESSLTDALSGAACAFAQAVTQRNDTCNIEKQRIPQEKITKLRLNNLKQLRYIKQLYDDNILTETEYTEQKQNILHVIQTLHS